jgi:hypothetical protein
MANVFGLVWGEKCYWESVIRYGKRFLPGLDTHMEDSGQLR